MCALSEVSALLSRLQGQARVEDPVVRYLGALFAELAYYHVPEAELDDSKRALLIPCESYQDLVQSGSRPNVLKLVNQVEIPESDTFIVTSPGVIVVGVRVHRTLFLGFRGTQFLFDWSINLRSSRVSLSRWAGRSDRFHEGFAMEAIRISQQIDGKLFEMGRGSFDNVVFSGHSLGGAVAAISALILEWPRSAVCLMGAPRYCNLSALASGYRQLPMQVRRAGDGVPTVPPKFLGYADHLRQISTDGSAYSEPDHFSGLFGGFVRWAAFLVSGAKSHSVESYRKEMGRAAGAAKAESDLTWHPRLTNAHVRKSKSAP